MTQGSDQRDGDLPEDQPEDQDGSRAEDVLTVAQAAPLLGVSERALRRLLARPEYAALSRQVSRPTRRGVRQTAVIPPRNMDVLRGAVSTLLLMEQRQETFSAIDGDKNTAVRGKAIYFHGADADIHGVSAADGGGFTAQDRDVSFTASEGTAASEPSAQYAPPMMGALTATLPGLAAAYELALRAKEDVVREQAARIDDLRAALEHERAQSRELTTALAREQALRVLPAPQAEPLAQAAAPEASNSGHAAPETVAIEFHGVQVTSEKNAPSTSEGKATWWQRFWTRSRDS